MLLPSCRETNKYDSTVLLRKYTDVNILLVLVIVIFQIIIINKQASTVVIISIKNCYYCYYIRFIVIYLLFSVTRFAEAMSLSLLFNIIILSHFVVLTSGQVCPQNPECQCSGFIGTAPTAIACVNQSRTRIPVSEINTAVQSLDMSDNSIILEPNALSGLVNLTRLDLSGNSMAYVPAGSFNGLVSLEYLSLDGNLFTSETLAPDNFTGTENITTLSLASNGLTATLLGSFLSFFTKLRVFNLDSNLYQFLSPNFFDSLSATLEQLIISNNQLMNLPTSIFSSLSQLKSLDISGNNLYTLLPGIFTPLLTTDIRLADNPWSCDCYLINLTEVISSPGALNFIDASIAFCDVPSQLSTTPLSTVTVSNCTPPQILTHPDNSSILSTQSISLSCTSSGLPVPSTTWYFQGVFLINSFQATEGRFSVLTNGALLITAAQLSDTGHYYCVVSNTEGSVASSVANLLVEEITCFDNISSSHETDVDCGGLYCAPCALGANCVADTDCDNGICLYSHSIPSQLLYITKNHALAYTCNTIELGTEILQIRLASILFGSPGFLLNISSDLNTINHVVRQSLSSQLEIPLDVITSVNIRTIERYYSPLVQIYFYLENSHYGLMAQNLLIEQINTEKLRVTMKLETLQNSIAVRINF